MTLTQVCCKKKAPAQQQKAFRFLAITVGLSRVTERSSYCNKRHCYLTKKKKKTVEHFALTLL